MTVQAKAIVRGSHRLEILSPLPYEEGTELVLQMEASADEERDAIDLLKRLGRVIGLGRSGLSDVSQNKHKYLAETYMAHFHAG